MQDPGASSCFTYNTVSPGSDHLDTTSLVQGDMQPNHHFYQFPWFCRLMVLIYGLSLGIAGMTLWLFAYYKSSLVIQYRFMSFVRLYTPWLAYDFSIVWIFILASLFSSYTDISATAALRQPLVRSRWTGPFTYNIIVSVLLGSSAAVGYLITSLWVKRIESKGYT